MTALGAALGTAAVELNAQLAGAADVRVSLGRRLSAREAHACLAAARSGTRFALVEGDGDELMGTTGAATVAFGAVERAGHGGAAVTAEQAVSTTLSWLSKRSPAADTTIVLLTLPFDALSAPSAGPSVTVPALALHQAAAPSTAPAVLVAHLGADPARWNEERAVVAALMVQLAAAPAPHTAAPVTTSLAVAHLPDRRGHAEMVAGALARIADGTLEKVVLARRSSVALSGVDAAATLARAHAAEPSATAMLIDGIDDTTFIAVSPEWLYRRAGTAVSCDALAGTAPRSASPVEDAQHAARLLDSAKERHEHAVVRAMLMEALAPLCVHVDAAAQPSIKRLTNVQHLHTRVTATLRAARPLVSVLHPTPAVCGVPRAAALEAIAALEPFARGQYAGVVGVVTSDGEDCAVALRCAQVSAAEVVLFAGGGLVRGADPAREWDEVERKSAGMMAALCGRLPAERVTGSADAR